MTHDQTLPLGAEYARTRSASDFSAFAPVPEPHDLVRVLAAWRGHARLILATLALALGAAAAWVHFAIPQYTARATIAIDPRKQVVMRNPAVFANMTTDSPTVDTQEQLLRSRAVLGLAATALETAGAFDRPPYRAASTATRIEALSAAFDVHRVGLTSALELTFTADDPALAAGAVNAIAAAYIEYQQQLKQQATRDANRWLGEQVVASQRLLNEVSSAADRYRTQTGLLDENGASSAESLAANEQRGLSSAERDVSDVRIRLIAAEGALRTRGAAAAAQLIDTPNMRELRTTYASVAGRKAQLSATHGAHHPQIIEIDQQLRELRAQTDAEVRRAIVELRGQVVFAENRLAASQHNSALLRSQLARDSQAQVHLGEFNARATPMRRMYEDLLNRLQQTMAQQSLDQINATVVSAAPIPLRATSPNGELAFAVATAAGLGLALLVAFLLDVFDTRVRRQADFERRTHVPVIATIPELRRSDLRIAGSRVALVDLVPADPMGRFADAFRHARVALPMSDQPDCGLIVQFTSATFSEGKTVCSLGFAQTAAADNQRVLLIDADSRRASLTRALNVSVDKGLLEVLAGTATLDETLLYAEAMQLHILPLSKCDSPSGDLFSSRNFADLTEQLRTQFDLVVIDTAPVLGSADALALSSRVDAVVMAARWATTAVAMVEKALEAVRRVNGRIAGVVFTRVDAGSISWTAGMHPLEPVSNAFAGDSR
ncbi:MAG: AAA family ATPase [Steroidobacteraceae bacterium]